MKKVRNNFLLLYLCAAWLLTTSVCTAQTDADSTAFYQRRLKRYTLVAAGTYGATLATLNHLWYQDSQRQSFRFFNDNAEWKQVDKFGHALSAFYISYGTASALRQVHVRPRKADLIGALTGFGVMLPIEIFDGFSDAYGASTGDLLANATGASLYYVQAALWQEVRIYPRFSFHTTRYAPLRPNVLGHDWTSAWLKDYNGQTYWLSVDMDKFIAGFPRWLNLAAGYGAEGMVYARDSQNISAGYGRAYRQYYLSLDLDLSAIRSRSKVIRTLLRAINVIKIPGPTLALSQGRVRGYALYF